MGDSKQKDKVTFISITYEFFHKYFVAKAAIKPYNISREVCML